MRCDVRRTMRIKLGAFTCRGIEAFLGRDIERGVEAALRHYAEHGERESARKALSGFASYPDRGHGAELELALDPEIEAVLRREARESGGIPVNQVVGHAVLAYLADLDWVSELEKRPLTHV
jgi:hypothetical protein